MRYLRVEGALRSSVSPDLPAYAVADAASEALLWVIDNAGFEAHEGNEPRSTAEGSADLRAGLCANYPRRDGCHRK